MLVKGTQDLKFQAMLHLHRASRNVIGVFNLSRNHLRSYTPKYVSSCAINFNVRKHRVNNLHSIGLQKLSAAPSFYQSHCYSTKKGDEEADAIEAEAEAETPPNDFIHTHLPATVAVPEVWPYLPCIATSRNPVFPRFMKILEVRDALSTRSSVS